MGFGQLSQWRRAVGRTDGPGQKMEWKIPSGQKIRGRTRRARKEGQSWLGLQWVGRKVGWMEGVISKRERRRRQVRAGKEGEGKEKRD